MSPELPSLIDSSEARSAAAPFLFLVDPDDGINEMEVRGEFTAERLMERRPSIYRAVVDALGQGLGVRQICRAYKVSHHTVAAVMAREPKAIATVKEGTIGKLRQFAMMAADRLLDEVHTMPVGSIPLAMGIAIDKAQLLDGGATSRIEHADAGPTHEDYLRMVLGNVIEAEILPGTGLSGGEKSAIEPASGRDLADQDADPAAQAADLQVPGAGSVCENDEAQFDIQSHSSDAESAAFDQSDSVDHHAACSYACLEDLIRGQSKEGDHPCDDHPDSRASPGRLSERDPKTQLEGGGGGPVSTGAVPDSTDPAAENF